MSDFWSKAGKLIGQTQLTIEQARKEAERLAQMAQGQLDEAGKAIHASTAQATQKLAKVAADVVGADSPIAQAAAQAHKAVAPPAMQDLLDLTALPENLRVAFYGALFAMAAADGTIDKDELQLIFELVDVEGMSPGGRQTVQSYIIEPPLFARTLAPFAQTAETLRMALLLNLVEVAWANDLILPAQEQLLAAAQQTLAISAPQYAAIVTFVKELRRIRAVGLNDNLAADAVKTAAAGLTAVGVPIAAVYISGSVFGLSAAGITSGLAALGLGLGMVPGIGIAVLLGVGVFLGVRSLLDTGQEREKERLRAEATRKAQLVIQNLQETINLLIARVQALQGAAADATTNQQAIMQLNDRMRVLQQILARRQDLAAALG